MRRSKFAGITRRPRLYHVLLVGHFAAAAIGCTEYSELDIDGRSDGRTDGRSPTNDGSQPTIDGPLPDGVPPVDTGTGSPDVGSGADRSISDAAPDAPSVDGPSPPPDAGTRSDVVDVGTDAGADATTDATIPPRDADAGVDAGPDADASTPPRDASPPDTGAPDVVDAGTRDADASTPPPPPPDADAGPDPVDVRDAGPPCWGTPSTNDEDNDGVVDECDNCPSIANANQANVREVNAGNAADGVGDACDPRPDDGGDSIFLFDGMNFTTIPPEWVNVGAGSWTADGSSLSPNGILTGQELARTFPSSLGNYLAETAFTFNALDVNGSANLPFRMDGSGNGWRCVVGTPDGISGQFFLGQVIGGVSETPPVITSIPVPRPGSRYRVLAGGYGTNIYCMLGSTERQNRSGANASGQAGIRCSGTDASFEYLLVYRLGGTIP